MVYGYARVSTAEQNSERQLQQLQEYVTDKRNIIIDKASGKNFDRRGYNTLVGTDLTAPILRAGDLLIITSLDRLGRNYTEIKEEWRRLTQHIGCDVQVIEMPLLNTKIADTSLDGKFIADLVLQILGYVSEKERINIKERQMQGIRCMPIVKGKRVSSRTGKPTGRPTIVYPENWVQIYDEWKLGNITAVKAMRLLGLKRCSFYKLVHKYEDELET